MNPVVTTRQGAVRGSLVDNVYTFKGVPYAAPPFGVNRLLPPQPAESWSGERDATAWGAEVPQLWPDPQIRAMVPDPAVPGEDCLNLNIWTPDIGAAGLPVMVWIHGGMFEAGTGASYDGSRFARDGVVCVTINYRVGPEGFLLLEGGTPNLGLLDQVAALTWVRENIAAFGGDPGNVTIFGESAGAMSVGVLLGLPAAEGLFRRAICESGAAHTVISAAGARRVARDFAARLGVPPTREAVGAVPVKCILQAHAELRADLQAHPDPDRWGLEVVTTTLPWQPVVDGEILPVPPIERIAAGSAARVDLIAGTNTDDWRLFAVVSGALAGITDQALTGSVADYAYQSLAAYGLPVEKALAAYRAAYPCATPGDLLAAVQTDWWVRIPAIRLAEAQTAFPGSTYMYEFAWPSPAFGGMPGSCHALEIPFVFDTLDRGGDQLAGPLLGTAPPQALADKMHAAWVGFATRGDPGWPKYDRSRRATMRFDTVSEVVDDPRKWERELWAGIR